MGQGLNLEGQKFGRLTVISRHGSNKHNSRTWNCLCECGNRTIVCSYNLRSGNSYSCGCYARERTREIFTKHGFAKTPVRNSWEAMMSRCFKQHCPGYEDYGGRGITVCERWKKFENFLADMGERPAGTSLDRIDNDGNYEPSNCRWATEFQQKRNTRRTVFVVHDGIALCLKDWANKLGIKPMTIWTRHSRGWEVPDLFAPPQKRTYNREKLKAQLALEKERAEA